eukprot:CAMPEP_0171258096 /NCGR_PEP_ID=MMETSP0790-20130122/54201_1 /TAXON_ID=2925 /ORGANISM="Alexandrium catenella, Strain OF101" /LENGTH=291 /DNA_ID=CAMNT_0011726259 /DNA_START=327 /DNA_END=1204 /DNA_ORIENTATION=-
MAPFAAAALHAPSGAQGRIRQTIATDVDCIPAVGEGSLTALVGVVQAGRRVGACHTQLRNCSTCCNTFCPMLNRRVRQITVPARPLPPCINVVNIVQAASRAGVCDIGLHRNLDGLLREDLLGHLSDVPDPSLRRHRLLRTLLGPDVALRAPLVIAQLLDAVGKAALRAASTLALLVPDAQGLLVELSDANLLLAMRKPAAFLITLALLVGLAELRLVKVRRVLQLCARVCEEALVAKVALALQVLEQIRVLCKLVVKRLPARRGGSSLDGAASRLRISKLCGEDATTASA